MAEKIERILSIEDSKRANRVTALYGPRRVGKTTLVNNYLDNCMSSKKILRVTSDDIKVVNILESRDLDLIKDWVQGYDIVFVDEAQRITNIGLSLKLLADAVPDLEIIVTGSASFDLSNKIGEPLTGRITPLLLYPISILELAKTYNTFEIQSKLNDYLIYGMYPEVITAKSTSDKKFFLNELVSNYLLKDALELERVKSSKILFDLLTLLAYQIGKEVSQNELGNSLGIDKKTVARYLDILEKCFIIHNIRGFSRNLRSEITKTSRYYFYDIGIRNALIGNFSDITLRNDKGDIFENFFVMEKLKSNSYKNMYSNSYFWRTWEQCEIDYIEEMDGKLIGYEVKWNPRKLPKPPKQWVNAYGENGNLGNNLEFNVVNSENYINFL
jgi:predicted AAA+ superfamily ATPase